jgi:hypothetical protein
MDDRANLPLRRGIKRLINVRHIGSGGADDAQAAHIQTFHI